MPTITSGAGLDLADVQDGCRGGADGRPRPIQVFAPGQEQLRLAVEKYRGQPLRGRVRVQHHEELPRLPHGQHRRHRQGTIVDKQRDGSGVRTRAGLDALREATGEGLQLAMGQLLLALPQGEARAECRRPLLEVGGQVLGRGENDGLEVALGMAARTGDARLLGPRRPRDVHPAHAPPPAGNVSRRRRGVRWQMTAGRRSAPDG
jgi:hypothetical protein